MLVWSFATLIVCGYYSVLRRCCCYVWFGVALVQLLFPLFIVYLFGFFALGHLFVVDFGWVVLYLVFRDCLVCVFGFPFVVGSATLVWVLHV